MAVMVARLRAADEVEAAVAGGADAVLMTERMDTVATAVAGRIPIWALTHDHVAAPTGSGAAALIVPADPLRVLGAATPMALALFNDRLPDAGDLDGLNGISGALAMFSGRAVDAVSPAALAEFAALCRARGLSAGLSGGLEAPDVPRLLAAGLDTLVFRRALCSGGDPGASLDPDRVRLIRDLMPRDPAPEPVPSLAAVGRPDRIFVRDLVLPMAVGAYVSEADRIQRVRFSVDADLVATGRPAQDMRDIVSYDLITDAVARVATAGHVDLVETLAERIAAAVLRHARVSGVRVKVEKLDLGPGSVGVEIWRDRGWRSEG